MKDEKFMQLALNLAQKGGRNAAPNPMVGCVIVHKDELIGSGYHKLYGGPHAEVNAVNSVKDKSLLPYSTIYVTLEPCAHFGKTPPCADLIVKSNFKRCVIACTDTFSEVAGKGIDRIKNAGIEVRVGTLLNEARSLNKRFFTYHEKSRPYVILKWAQTQDAFIDKKRKEAESGVNWITGNETKKLVHQWRSEEQAILVGWKTLENDDASLTVREVEGKNPLRVILDPSNSISNTKSIFKDGVHTLILSKTRRTNLPQHIEQIVLPKINAKEILNVLHKRNILSVFVEGGAYTLQSFIDSELWDEARVFTGEALFHEGLPSPRLGKYKNSVIDGPDKLQVFYR